MAARAIGKFEINGRRYAPGDAVDARDESAALARGWAQRDWRVKRVPSPTRTKGEDE